MKILKNFFRFKLPDFKTWRQEFLAKLVIRRFWNQKVKHTSAGRFWLLLIALILISGLEFVLGFYFIWGMNHQLINNNQRYDKEMAIVYDLQVNLAKLPVIYYDELSGNSFATSKQIFSDIRRKTRQLKVKNAENRNLKFFRASITKVAKYIGAPSGTNYYELWAEARKARVY
jgi:hypothetical protein